MNPLLVTLYGSAGGSPAIGRNQARRKKRILRLFKTGAKVWFSPITAAAAIARKAERGAVRVLTGEEIELIGRRRAKKARKAAPKRRRRIARKKRIATPAQIEAVKNTALPVVPETESNQADQAEQIAPADQEQADQAETPADQEQADQAETPADQEQE